MSTATTLPPPGVRESVWISTTQMAAELGMCTRTLRRMLQRGDPTLNLHARSLNPSSRRRTFVWHRERTAKKLGAL